MLFKTHLALGIIAGILAVSYLQPESKVLFAAVLAFASVLPDIDSSKSKVGKAFGPLSWVVNLVFGHRGFMHTLFPPVIALLAFGVAGWTGLGIAFLMGYGLHLAADMATRQGIMPFYPVSRIRASGPLKTGGLTEFLVLFAAVLGLIYLFITTIQ